MNTPEAELAILRRLLAIAMMREDRAIRQESLMRQMRSRIAVLECELEIAWLLNQPARVAA